MDTLLAYTDWLRAEWRRHLAVDPARLRLDLGPHRDARFATVGEVVRHIFGAELRYVDRIRGRPATDVSGVPSDDVAALFDLGAESRAALVALRGEWSDDRWETEAVYPIGAFEFQGTPRKILTHTLIHEIRHWAQLSTLLRLEGAGPGLQDFLVSPVLGGEFRRRVAIRPGTAADAPDAARVNVTSWRAEYRHLFSDAFLDGLSVEGRTAAIAARFGEPGYGMLVAEDADHGVVGFADWGPPREASPHDRELFALYVLPGHQGRGLGRRLVTEAARRVLDDGATSLMLSVFTDNPHRAFYPHLGGREIGREAMELDGGQHEVVFYAWSHDALRQLTGPAAAAESRRR